MNLEKGFYLIFGLLYIGRLGNANGNGNYDTIITEQIGKSVTLECPIDFESCGELHSLNWFKGDTRIAVLLGGTNSSNVEKEFIDRVETAHSPYRLNIRDLRLEDEDIYTCDTTFFIPQETCEVSRGYRIELNVLVQPSEIVIYDKDNNRIENGTVLGPLKEGHTLRATCMCKDTRPQPTMAWYRGDKRLTTHSPTYDENEGLFTATLELSLVLSRQDLASNIECRVESPALDGIVRSHIKLDLQVRPTGINLSGVEHHTVQGTRTTLSCKVFGARPVANITWTNGTRIIDPNDDNDIADVQIHHKLQSDGTYQTEGQLIFTATRFENDVIFGCEATNIVLVENQEKPMHTVLSLEVMYPPVVKVSPDNIFVNASEKVLLNCEYVANPAQLTQVQWFRNGELVRINESSRFEGGSTENPALIIKTTHRGDGGNYSCELKNSVGIGISDTQIDLDVQYVPIVEILMIPEGAVKENDEANVTLYCNIIDANPSALQRVRWYANSSLLKELPDCNELNEDFCNIDPSRLLLESIGRGFAYNYSCEGFNAAGWGPRSDEKELVVYYEPGPAILSHYPLVAIKKKSVIFSCSVDVPGVPEATRYRWFRGGQGPLMDVVTKDWTVDPVGLDSRTNFSCYAYNDGGFGISAVVNLTVHAPPFFIKNLFPYTGILYSTKNASLMCRVECVPRCEISWFKDGIGIDEQSHRYFIKEEYMAASPATGDFESMMSVLHFNMSAWPNQQFDIHSDNANYSCVSSENVVGPGVRSATYFSIEYQPENTTVSNEHVNVTEDTIPGRVLCTSKANPEPSFEWNFNNKTVARGNALIINKPMSRNSTGYYKCLAYNKHGSSMTETFIDVQYKPRCTIERKILNDEDTLICTAFGNPKESGFSWSIKSENDSDPIYNDRIEIDKSHLILDEDFTITRTYRCVANNSVGVGQFCEIEVAVRPKRQLAWWQRWDRTTLFIVIAAVVAILLAVIIICCIIICICRRRRRQDKYHTEAALCATQSVLSYQPASPMPTLALQSPPEVPKSPPKWPLRPGVMVHVKNDTKQNLCANRLKHKRSLSSSTTPQIPDITQSTTTTVITTTHNTNNQEQNNAEISPNPSTIEQNPLESDAQTQDNQNNNVPVTIDKIENHHKSLPRPPKPKSLTLNSNSNSQSNPTTISNSTVARVNPNNTVLTTTPTISIVDTKKSILEVGKTSIASDTKPLARSLLLVPPERPPKLPRRNHLPNSKNSTNRNDNSTSSANELLPRRNNLTIPARNTNKKCILPNNSDDDDDEDDDDDLDDDSTIGVIQQQQQQDNNTLQICSDINGNGTSSSSNNNGNGVLGKGGGLFEKIFGEIFSKRNDDTVSINSERSENKLLRYFGMSKVFKRQRLGRSDSNVSSPFDTEHRIKGIRCSGTVVTYKKTPILERVPLPLQQLTATNNKEHLLLFDNNCNALLQTTIDQSKSKSPKLNSQLISTIVETKTTTTTSTTSTTSTKLHDKSSSLGDPLTEPGEYENLPFHGLQTAPNKFTTTPINFNNQTNVVRVAPRPKLTQQNNNNLIHHPNHLLQHQQQQQQQHQQQQHQHSSSNYQIQQKTLQIPSHKKSSLISISPSSSSTLKSISSDKRKPLLPNTNTQLITGNSFTLNSNNSTGSMEPTQGSAFPTNYTDYYNQQKCTTQKSENCLNQQQLPHNYPYTVVGSLSDNCSSTTATSTNHNNGSSGSVAINNPFLASNFKKFHTSTGSRSGCGTITASSHRKKQPHQIISTNNSAIIGPDGEKKFYSLKALKNNKNSNINLLAMKPSFTGATASTSISSKCKRHHSFAGAGAGAAGSNDGGIMTQNNQQLPYSMQPKMKFYEPPMYENLTDSIQIHESDEYQNQQQPTHDQSYRIVDRSLKVAHNTNKNNVGGGGGSISGNNRKIKQQHRPHQHQHQKIDEFNNLMIEPSPPDERMSIYRSDSGISNSSYECVTPIPAPRQPSYNNPLCKPSEVQQCYNNSSAGTDIFDGSTYNPNYMMTKDKNNHDGGGGDIIDDHNHQDLLPRSNSFYDSSILSTYPVSSSASLSAPSATATTTQTNQNLDLNSSSSSNCNNSRSTNRNYKYSANPTPFIDTKHNTQQQQHQHQHRKGKRKNPNSNSLSSSSSSSATTANAAIIGVHEFLGSNTNPFLVSSKTDTTNSSSSGCITSNSSNASSGGGGGGSTSTSSSSSSTIRGNGNGAGGGGGGNNSSHQKHQQQLSSPQRSVVMPKEQFQVSSAAEAAAAISPSSSFNFSSINPLIKPTLQQQPNNNQTTRNNPSNNSKNNPGTYNNDKCFTQPSNNVCNNINNKQRYPGYVTRPVKLPLRKHHSFHFQQQYQQQQQPLEQQEQQEQPHPQQTMLGHLKLHQIQREKAKVAAAAAAVAATVATAMTNISTNTTTKNNQPNNSYKQNGGPLVFQPFLNENTAFKPISPVGCNNSTNNHDDSSNNSSQLNSLQSDCSSSSNNINSSYSITMPPRICGTSLKRHLSNVESYDSNRYDSENHHHYHQNSNSSPITANYYDKNQEIHIIDQNNLNGQFSDNDSDDEMIMNQDDDARSSASNSTIVGKRLVYVDLDTVSLNMRSNRNYRIYEKGNNAITTSNDVDDGDDISRQQNGGIRMSQKKTRNNYVDEKDPFALCSNRRYSDYDDDDLIISSDNEQFRASNRLRQISSFPSIKDKSLRSTIAAVDAVSPIPATVTTKSVSGTEDNNADDDDDDDNSIECETTISSLGGIILAAPATPTKRTTHYATLKYNEVNI